MKVIGMIGGMSWESTVTYYQVVNRVVKERLGGFHSAKCIIFSVDFHELEANMSAGAWDRNAAILSAAARSLEGAGADCVMICTNTMHKVADEVAASVAVPLLHIAELTADELDARSVRKVGLLGTKYTMEQDFYKERLRARGIEVFIPGETARGTINDIIFGELCLGGILPESKAFFLGEIGRLRAEGAEGMVLGCTEIGLLLNQDDTDCPLFDTALIHARRAALFALGEKK